MKKRAKLIDMGYAISAWSTDLMHLRRKLLEGARLPEMYKRFLLRSFMTWVLSMFQEKERSKVGTSRTHRHPILRSRILGRDRRGRGERIVRYALTKTFQVDHMGKPKILRYVNYRALTDTRVGCIATVVCL